MKENNSIKRYNVISYFFIEVIKIKMFLSIYLTKEVTQKIT
jgi:hypothetical protein